MVIEDLEDNRVGGDEGAEHLGRPEQQCGTETQRTVDGSQAQRVQKVEVRTVSQGRIAARSREASEPVKFGRIQIVDRQLHQRQRRQILHAEVR